jgi:molybdate transport system substrate-binding protein
MFFRFNSGCLFAALALFIGGTSTLQASERVRIGAASSLRYAFEDILTLYQASHPQADIQVIYGSSGKMTTQIINGAPFDIFFSADAAYPGQLKEAGLTSMDPEIYATGRIVMWSNTIDAGNLSLDDLNSQSIRRIAIAQPAHAPYGRLAREALQSAGVWEGIQGKLVFGENIAHAAQMAHSGAAEVAIVALSLAKAPGLASHDYSLIDKALHTPLNQGFVVTLRGEDNPEALIFADFMRTPAVNSVLTDYGFITPE